MRSFLIISSLIVSLAFYGCSNDDDSMPAPQTSVFYHSLFFIDNQSPYRLRFERPYLVIDALANDITEIHFPKSATDTMKVFPEDSFSLLHLFAYDSLLNEVGDYGPQPVVNEDWNVEESSEVDTIFTTFTLRILESDLNL